MRLCVAEAGKYSAAATRADMQPEGTGVKSPE